MGPPVLLLQEHLIETSHCAHTPRSLVSWVKVSATSLWLYLSFVVSFAEKPLKLTSISRAIHMLVGSKIFWNSWQVLIVQVQRRRQVECNLIRWNVPVEVEVHSKNRSHRPLNWDWTNLARTPILLKSGCQYCPSKSRYNIATKTPRSSLRMVS